MLSINNAAVPETSGAAILVPPNKANDSCFESFFNFVTDVGVKL